MPRAKPAAGLIALAVICLAAAVSPAGARSPAAATSACRFRTAPHARAAYCDTFARPMGTGNRSGQLDGTVWGVSRATSANNPSQRLLYDWTAARRVRIYASDAGRPGTLRLIAHGSFPVPLTRGLTWLEDVTIPGVTHLDRAVGALLEFTYWPEHRQAITYSLNGHASHRFPWPFANQATFVSETAAMPVPLAELHDGVNVLRVRTSDPAGVSIANIDLILRGAGGVQPPLVEAIEH